MSNLLTMEENEVFALLMEIPEIKTGYYSKRNRLIQVFEGVKILYMDDNNKIVSDIDKREFMSTAVPVLCKRETELRKAINNIKRNYSKKEKYRVTKEELMNLTIPFGQRQLNFYEKFFFLLLGKSIENDKV